ncbi:hypothetical protein EVAR_82741_1 [Eumeta japonica]|uniref:Uncharacterized protein n=1 Tax=Eumeta variegata TaxID=151549 RepID=A0A4C2A2E1_EUMVA|nr:hypothetical protein EVAR_82741_1 [Eumeta japonica]
MRVPNASPALAERRALLADVTQRVPRHASGIHTAESSQTTLTEQRDTTPRRKLMRCIAITDIGAGPARAHARQRRHLSPLVVRRALVGRKAHICLPERGAALKALVI